LNLRSFNASVDSSFVFGVIASLLTVLGFGVWSISIGQDANWDLFNYHFYNPYALINDRIGFDYAPAQVQTYLNPLPDIPYYLAAQVLSPIQVSFCLGMIHSLNAILVYAIARLFFRKERFSLIRSRVFAGLCVLGALSGAGFDAEGVPRRRLTLVDAGVVRDLGQGEMTPTGASLDFAINGKGFFAVQTPNGMRYTRDGHFSLNQDGQLVTSDGYAVQGDGGNITMTNGTIV